MQVGTLYKYGEHGLLHLNINIVYSKVLHALSIILTNQCDMSKFLERIVTGTVR